MKWTEEIHMNAGRSMQKPKNTKNLYNNLSPSEWSNQHFFSCSSNLSEKMGIELVQCISWYSQWNIHLTFHSNLCNLLWPLLFLTFSLFSIYPPPFSLFLSPAFHHKITHETHTIHTKLLGALHNSFTLIFSFIFS